MQTDSTKMHMQAPTTTDGLVQYIQFVPMAASMVYSMYDVDNMKLRLQVGLGRVRGGVQHEWTT